MTESGPPPPTPKASRVLVAAAIYFGLVFAVGLLLGPARVLWLEPWLGKALSVLAETPLLVGAMWFAAPAAVRWAHMRGGWFNHLAVGVVALALQQIADLAVGFGLRGMTLPDQLAYFATPAGAIYAVTLVVFALMPLSRARRQGAAQ